jgi:hypothetical protein
MQRSISTVSRLRRLPLTLAACFLCAGQASAAFFSPNAASVQETVTQQQDGLWRYDFSIKNDSLGFPSVSNVINEYLIPYYNDSSITWLATAPNWSSSVVAGNAFGLANADTLHFTADSGFGIGPQSISGVFSFTSTFGAAKAPFEVIFGDGFPFKGDPSIPASPLALSDGLAPVNAVPEPSTIALVFAGLGLVGAIAFRNRRKSKLGGPPIA